MLPLFEEHELESVLAVIDKFAIFVITTLVELVQPFTSFTITVYGPVATLLNTLLA